MTLNVINYLENVDKNSEFLIIIIAVIAVLLVLIFIFNFLSNHKAKSTSRLQRLNKKKLFKEIEEESKNIDVSSYKQRTQKRIEKPEKVVEEKIEIKNSLPEEEKLVQIQPEKIEKIEEEEIIEVIQDEDESDVDRILRDIKKASKEETMNLTEFEREQEETAIISYDELCRKAGVQKKVYKAQPKEEAVQKAIDKVVEEKPKGKYTPTKFVSPIFGVQNEKKAYIDVSSEEDLDKTFLQNLKEFRSGLE
ncbi:MAG: hypothetical protein IKF36_03805 [Bacilli bacterium]|nr:hypothetical protein [Bacilli bacterium]